VGDRANEVKGGVLWPDCITGGGQDPGGQPALGSDTVLIPMIVEILRFRLAAGVDESVFEAADKRVQTEFAYQQPGLVRRTTARGRDGSWMVIDVWGSDADADRAGEHWGQDAVTEVFTRLVDVASLTSERFETLD
jgi:hypothetical protein